MFATVGISVGRFYRMGTFLACRERQESDIANRAEFLRNRTIAAMTTDGAAIQLDLIREYNPDN